MSFKSRRISKPQNIFLDGTIDQVFPLFGRVREKEWAEGWNPEVIFSTSNRVEEKMVFKTKAIFSQEQDYIWIISHYRPENKVIEYLVFTHERLWTISIHCVEASSVKTKAEIIYTYTGLTEKGNNLNRNALEKIYAQDLKDWQKAINYYWSAGQCFTE